MRFSDMLPQSADGKAAENRAPTGRILVGETLGGPELLPVLLRLARGRYDRLYFFRVSRFAHLLLRVLRLHNRVEQTNPSSLPITREVERIAFELSASCDLAPLLRDPRMRVLTRLAGPIDLSLAIRKALAQGHYHRTARIVATVRHLAQMLPVGVECLPEVFFDGAAHFPAEIRHRLCRPPRAISALDCVVVALRTICSNAITFCKLPLKAVVILGRRPFIRPPQRGASDLANARVIAEVHCPTQLPTYRDVIEPGPSGGELLYLYLVPVPAGAQKAVRDRGVRSLALRDIPIDMGYVLRRVVRPCLTWLALAPLILLSRSRAYVNDLACLLLGSLWRWEPVCNALSCQVFFSQDTYSADAAIRSTLLRARNARSVNYLHGEFFPAAPNALSQAYHNVDCFCSTGAFYSRHFEALGAHAGGFVHTGSHVLDRIFAFCRGLAPVSSALQELAHSYQVLVAFSGGADGSTISEAWAERFWAVLLNYVDHNPKAFLLFKLHPVEFAPPGDRLYRGSDPHPRIRVLRDEYDVGELVAVADLVTTTCSTAGLESLAAGKNVVYLDFSGNPDLIPYRAYSARLAIDQMDAVPRLFDRYLAGERVISPAMQAMITREHMTAFDGKAGERVRAAIARCLRRAAGDPTPAGDSPVAAASPAAIHPMPALMAAPDREPALRKERMGE